MIIILNYNLAFDNNNNYNNNRKAESHNDEFLPIGRFKIINSNQ